MTRWIRCTVVMLAMATWSAGVDELAAQPRVYVQSATWCAASSCPDRLLTVALSPLRILSETPLPVGVLPASYVTPEGRFAIGLAGHGPTAALVVRDIVTGSRFAVSVPGASGMIGNPHRTEVYLGGATGARVVSFAGVRALPVPGCGPTGPTPLAVSVNGSRVAFRCFGGPGATVVIDTVTGALAGSLDFMVRPVFGRDGHDVYSVEWSASSRVLRRYDVATGAVLAEWPVDSMAESTSVDVDARTGNVVLWQGRAVASRVLTADLTPIASTFGPIGASWTFDPHQPRAYGTYGEWVELGWGMGSLLTFNLITMDTSAWTVVAGGGATTSSPVNGAVIALPPGPATGLNVAVAGRVVSLSWAASTPSAAVTGYVVEAGSAPGLTNVGTFAVGLQTGFAAAGVPPGTYYVRVRAANVTGSSAPSNEVVVQVQ